MMSVSNLDMDNLVHLSQLSKMIDMPHYSFVRMQLLYPERYPDLVETFRGIMMLLPQGKAFDSLRNRLECSCLLNTVAG